jgi:hypothetical protein
LLPEPGLFRGTGLVRPVDAKAEDGTAFVPYGMDGGL